MPELKCHFSFLPPTLPSKTNKFRKSLTNSKRSPSGTYDKPQTPTRSVETEQIRMSEPSSSCESSLYTTIEKVPETAV